MDEVFVPITWAKGHYEISNTGKVRSVLGGRRRGIELKQSINTTGRYSVVTLVVNRRKKYRKVHRLVASTFLDNPLNKPCVNHIDGDKQNNSTDNLEWCTRSENIKHAYAILGKRNPRSKLSLEQVSEIRDRLAKNERGNYIAIDFGVSPSAISLINRGKTYKIKAEPDE